MSTTNTTVKSVAKSATITPVYVKFHDDTIPAFVGNDGEIYAAARQVLRNIGFDEERCKTIRKKWSEDEVISQRGGIFPLVTKTRGVQDTYCFPHKILPLALAKIAITPTLKKEYPEVVEKLVAYQLECADVLFRHFSPSYKEHKVYSDPSVPLTREELAMYFTYFVNSSNEYMSNTAKMITDHITAVDKRLDVLTQGYDDLRNTFNSLRSGYQTVLKGYTNSESRATALETALTDYLNRKETSPTVTSNVATPVADVPVTPTSATPDSIFTNSLDPDATTAWVKDVWCAASAIAAKSHTDSHDALREIYKIIRQNGTQLSGLYGDWKQNNPHRAMVNMISESDYLRGEAEKAIRELYDKYYPERNAKKDQMETATPSKVYKSQLLLSTPPEVRKCIEAVSNRDNLVYNRAAASVYREIERRIKEDLRLLADNFAENEGYMHCSKAYYISQKPELMKVLGEISGVKLAA